MKTKWICEIGSNHNQDLNRCFKFIEEAKELSCWGIKFQLFFAEKLWSKTETIAKMSHWQLPTTFIPSIYKYCKDIDIELGFSVFNKDSIEWLNNYTDFFKIGSYEIFCIDMIKQCYATGKPLFISTGLANENQVFSLNLKFPKITFLHCNSNYPAFVRNCNLIKIPKLRFLLDNLIGWSDHSKEPGVIYQAVANGASTIEFHLDIEGKGNEYSIGHCWLPGEIKQVIKTVKIMEQSQGTINYEIDSDLLTMRTDPETMKRNY